MTWTRDHKTGSEDRSDFLLPIFPTNLRDLYPFPWKTGSSKGSVGNNPLGIPVLIVPKRDPKIRGTTDGIKKGLSNNPFLETEPH